jgi:hypothetical protein
VDYLAATATSDVTTLESTEYSVDRDSGNTHEATRYLVKDYSSSKFEGCLDRDRIPHNFRVLIATVPYPSVANRVGAD